MDNGCGILLEHFVGLIPVSSPPLDFMLERSEFLVPRVRTLCPPSSPAYDIPKLNPSFLTFILFSPAVARLPDLIGTIPPFFPPDRGTL